MSILKYFDILSYIGTFFTGELMNSFFRPIFNLSLHRISITPHWLRSWQQKQQNHVVGSMKVSGSAEGFQHRPDVV